MGFNVIIPARYESSRLPGKPLLQLRGKPMIQHVHERALESGANLVAVATDDDRIRAVTEGFGAQTVMTAQDHASGTDRIAEAARALGLSGDDIIVNLQGDEPLMPPQVIQQVANDLARKHEADVATLCTPITSVDELFDPHVVKVVVDTYGYALYFSRAPVPWVRDAFPQKHTALPPDTAHFRHIGLYAYHAGFLQQYITWEPCDLERSEALEQLRVLFNHGKIHVAQAVEVPGPGVDTADDADRVEALLNQ